MWLPKSVYNGLPQYWCVLGLLFVAFGLYLGVNDTFGLLFALIGALCLAFGVTVIRTRKQQAGTESPDSKQ